ncbi:unnamed protein product, partial [Didymodactylos carnosus]
MHPRTSTSLKESKRIRIIQPSKFLSVTVPPMIKLIGLSKPNIVHSISLKKTFQQTSVYPSTPISISPSPFNNTSFYSRQRSSPESTIPFQQIHIL